MADNQKVDNNLLESYKVKTTETADGHVQHVKLESGGSSSSTASAPDTATVTDSSSEVLASNTDRKGAILVNDDDLDIYLAFGVDAVVGSGIRLNSNGGVFTMDAYSFTTQAINAIAASGSNNMTVQEFE